MAYKEKSPIPIIEGGTNASTMTTTDGVVYYDGSKLVTTSAGTSTQVLTSNGAGMAPTYQASSGSTGAIVFISSQTASNSASLTFTSGITSTYNAYMLIITEIVPATGGSFLNLRISSNGGSSYVATNYRSGVNYNNYATSAATNTNNTTYIHLSGPVDASNAGTSGTHYLFNLTAGTLPITHGNATSINSGNANLNIMGGNYTSTITINALQVRFSSGNIASGMASLYGILQ